jgi:endonuclease YncB( thermonuclease family)
MRPMRSNQSLFTPWQIVILMLCGLLVCLLAGLVIYLARFQPAAPVPQITALPALTATFRPARSLPPTFTPRPSATRSAASSPTPPPSLTPEPGACVPQDTEIRSGRVVSVLDGEGLRVDIQGVLVDVLYAGIQVPPGSASKNAELVLGQDVVLVKDISETDGAGRLLRYVLVGSRLINYELVRLGYARVIDSPDQACAQVLAGAEERARQAQVALWSPTRIPTLTFVPTVGFTPLAGVCDCSIRWDCTDFSSQARAQSCFNACNDYNSRLDEDHDGLACESLP